MVDVQHGGTALLVQPPGVQQHIPAATQGRIGLHFVSKSTDLIDVGRFPGSSSAISMMPRSAQPRRVSTANVNYVARVLPQQPQNDLHVSGQMMQIDARRGISRDRFENHPLPEKSHDAFSSHDYDHTYTSSPSYSGRSSPSRTDSEATSSWLSGSNGWTTGNTTERSSIYSLGEDEFDRAASRKVRALFEEIDSMLFEDKSGTHSLQAECKQWVSRFPHLRILGEQLLAPQDMGFQVVSTTGTPRPTSGMLLDVTEHDISLSHSMLEMSVTGRHVAAAQAPGLDNLMSELSSHHARHQIHQQQQQKDGSNPLEEEIFAEDGVIEDIIAVDYRTMDEDSRSSSLRWQQHPLHIQHRAGSSHYNNPPPRRSKRGDMPPVTPQACVKDNISGATFDFIWKETISWLRTVLANYSERIVPDSAGPLVDKLGTDFDLLPVGMSGSPRDMYPPSSREISLLSSSRGGNPLRQQQGGQAMMIGHIGGHTDAGLKGLLTISSKALITREKSGLGESLDSPLNAADMYRPISRLKFATGRPMSVKMNQDRLNSASRRQPPPLGRGRLAPLPQDRVKTPSMEEPAERLHNQVLRGFGLSIMHEQSSTSPPPQPHLNYPRNGALPPITLPSDQQPPGTPGGAAGTNDSAQKKKAHFNMQRASSAVHEKEPRIPFKDREKNTVPLETRPSTTHAIYRSETPGFGGLGTNRRSSTPMGISMRGPGGVGMVAAQQSHAAMQMSITGNSINPGSEGTAGAGGEMEDTDHFDVHTTHWGSPNFNPQIRRAKQQANMPVR